MQKLNNNKKLIHILEIDNVAIGQSLIFFEIPDRLIPPFRAQHGFGYFVVIYEIVSLRGFIKRVLSLPGRFSRLWQVDLPSEDFGAL